MNPVNPVIFYLILSFVVNQLYPGLIKHSTGERVRIVTLKNDFFDPRVN